MKKLLIVVVVFIVILGVSPKFIGSVVEDERQKRITLLNDIDGFDVRSEKYTTSWFGAQSTLEVTLQVAEEELGEITLTIDEDISFGPIIFSQGNLYFALGHSVLSFSSTDAIVDEEIMGFINKNIHVSATYTFTNNIVAHLNTDEITFEDGGTQFVAQPAIGEFSLINQEHIVGDLSWGGLNLKSSEGSLVIGSVSMDTQQSVVSGNYLQGTAILSGDAKFLVDSILVSDVTDSEVFSLSKLLFTTSVAIENDLLELSLKYGAEEIKTVGQTFKNPNLDIVLANLDINVLQELNMILASLPSDTSEQQISAELEAAIPEFADKLLAKDPTLKVKDLSLISEQGKLESEFTLRVDKDLFDSQNLMSVMTALNAEATGSAPIAFFTQFGLTPMLDNFVEQGYLIKADDVLSFSAQYSQAQLQVNGKDIAL